MDKLVERLTQWLTEAFQNPLSPLFFLLGAFFILLGVSNGFNVPGLNQVVPEVHFRGISVFIGVACCVFAVWLYYHPPLDSGSLIKVSQLQYDVFLSAPMAAYESNEQYQEAREEIKKVFDAFKNCGLKVYWAAEEIESMDDFDTKDISVITDLKAVKSSKYFCLIYPEKLVTSSLFEAGYALAFNKFSLYFVKQRSDLPFLMKDAASVFANVRIHSGDEWKTVDDIVKMIYHSKEKLFIQFRDKS